MGMDRSNLVRRARERLGEMKSTERRVRLTSDQIAELQQRVRRLKAKSESFAEVRLSHFVDEDASGAYAVASGVFASARRQDNPLAC